MRPEFNSSETLSRPAIAQSSFPPGPPDAAGVRLLLLFMPNASAMAVTSGVLASPSLKVEIPFAAIFASVLENSGELHGIAKAEREAD